MTSLPKHCPHCGHNLALETRPLVKNRCPVCGEDVRLKAVNIVGNFFKGLAVFVLGALL